MIQASIVEAKSKLSWLIETARSGEEVVLTSRGRPMVRLTPIQEKRTLQTGFLKGVFECPDDFDTAGQDEIIALFEDGHI
jgi:prevent-host-death family protein